ncbi:ras association domain-containing protein 8 isoform X2 [Episyrphus balteatus]|uniref:ras association domain-containing protein 8 isoform X2 n=1 Tax=Episyrphus balteatus TaxID=286459 RepID=UPI0024868A52|nr:ras association domain-containing protein 8 isoform X2 [Episyrphus balteatus]
MELKVWVEGIQRIVCGVTVNTTCQDVVFALAHATGKVGRFTLIERWRNNERLLAPTENPLKLLLKWGEYANDVQFILQRSEQTKRPAAADEKGHSQQFGATTATKKQPLPSNGSDSELHLQQSMQQQQQSMHAATEFMPLNRCKELRKSFGSSESPKPIENVGIVKGIPQRTTITPTQPSPTSPQKSGKHEKTPSNLSLPSSTSASDTMVNYYESNSSNEINLAEVRNSLDRRTTPPMSNINYSHQQDASNNNSNSNENLLDVFNGNTSNNNKYQATNSVSPDLYKNTPLISSNGALVPPPYRDPPPPRNSPMQLQQQTQVKLLEFSSGLGNNFNKKVDGACTNPFLSDMGDGDFNDNFFETAQYKDLIQLIKFQREKITSQQSELTKYDAEIVYLENKERDQAQELEAISREITKADQIFRQGSEQTLQYVEEENELVKQQEKTLKSEITLLRSKLANCETELLQCKNKIRILMDDVQVEQRAISSRQKDNRQNVERDFLIEMERIQTEIDQAIHNTDSSSKATDNLKKEINMIENAIAEKKRQVEQLVNEMKEVNLQSLAVTPSDEIRNLLEGSNKPGSSRRIIGSPRQLENAVPTSKNPHGVWV